MQSAALLQPDLQQAHALAAAMQQDERAGNPDKQRGPAEHLIGQLQELVSEQVSTELAKARSTGQANWRERLREAFKNRVGRGHKWTRDEMAWAPPAHRRDKGWSGMPSALLAGEAETGRPLGGEIL